MAMRKDSGHALHYLPLCSLMRLSFWVTVWLDSMSVLGSSGLSSRSLESYGRRLFCVVLANNPRASCVPDRLQTDLHPAAGRATSLFNSTFAVFPSSAFLEQRGFS